MSVHVQRKAFEAEELARPVAEAFNEDAWKIPNVQISAICREKDGVWWVYVMQVGDWVTGDEPLLPDYELVVAG